LKSFIESIVAKFATSSELESALLVFPTKRAGLFFADALAPHFNKAVWLPQIQTLDELASEISGIVPLDPTAQVFELFNIYKKVVPEAESISRFFSWGTMLLNDFNEIDAALANAKQTLAYVGSLKEIDAKFEGLEPEQIAHLRQFWESIYFQNNEAPSEEKEKFLVFWQQLPLLYAEFQVKCEELKAGGRGFRLKKAFESLNAKPWDGAKKYNKIIIAGFNALSNAEQELIKILVSKYEAEIVWDYGAWYLQMSQAEVAHYYNKLKRNESFNQALPSFAEIADVETNVQTYICGGITEETKLVADILRKRKSEIELKKIAIVVPDGSYLLPVLHAIPNEIETLNVTLQFQFKQTALFSFLKSYIDLRKDNNPIYSTKAIIPFLKNEYAKVLEPTIDSTIRRLIENNKPITLPSDFHKGSKLYEVFFEPASFPKQVFDNLFKLLNALVEPSVGEDWFKKSVEAQFFHCAYQQINALQEVLNNFDSGVDALDAWLLAKQVLGAAQIPFTGEPLIGLQIMQLQETMALDFDTVIFLGANEGILPPKFQGRGSFIPYNIRKAQRLDLPEHLAANHAYQFFRLVQRSKHIHILYSVGSDDTSNNEPSRFISQLKYLLDYPIKSNTLNTTVGTGKIPPISIPKSLEIMEQMYKAYGADSERGLSPSAINEYLDCGLRFYLHRIAKIGLPDELLEEMDAKTVGDIFHASIEAGYQPLVGKGQILQKADIEGVKKRAFAKLEDKVLEIFKQPISEIKGASILSIELIKNYLEKVIALDCSYNDLFIIAQEAEKPVSLIIPIPNKDDFKIKINGKIDRIDSLNGTIRIIDYKTGKDKTNYKSIEALFDRREGTKSGKAILQVFIYALMYLQDTEADFIPGIYKLSDIIKSSYLPEKDFKIEMGDFEEDIPFNKAYLEKFKNELISHLSNLLNPEIPFTQTTNDKNCGYCDFKNVCGR